MKHTCVFLNIQVPVSLFCVSRPNHVKWVVRGDERTD